MKQKNIGKAVAETTAQKLTNSMKQTNNILTALEIATDYQRRGCRKFPGCPNARHLFYLILTLSFQNHQLSALIAKPI